MEQMQFEEPIGMVGFVVNTFPEGIGEAFDRLQEILQEGKQRDYFGLSYMNAQNDVVYIVAARQKFDEDSNVEGLSAYEVPAGNYLSETIQNWQQNLSCIKDVFHQMMQHQQVDLGGFCIEWYYSPEEMKCMIASK